MRRTILAQESLLTSQPGELFPGNKLPFPDKAGITVSLSGAQPKAGGSGLAGFSVATLPDDPYQLGLTTPFKVVTPEEAEAIEAAQAEKRKNEMRRLFNLERHALENEELNAAEPVDYVEGVSDSNPPQAEVAPEVTEAPRFNCRCIKGPNCGHGASFFTEDEVRARAQQACDEQGLSAAQILDNAARDLAAAEAEVQPKDGVVCECPEGACICGVAVEAFEPFDQALHDQHVALTDDHTNGIEAIASALATKVNPDATLDAAAETVSKTEPLSEEEVKNVGLALEAFGELMPSFESFQDERRGPIARQLALESIEQAAKKVWDAILTAMKKAIEWLVAFVKSLLDISGKVRAAAIKLHEKVGHFQGRPSEEFFRDPNLASALQIEGKFPANVLKAAEETDKILSAELKLYSSEPIYQESYLKDLCEAVRTDKGTKKFTYVGGQEVAKMRTRGFEGRTGDAAHHYIHGHQVTFMSEQLVGGRYLERKVDALANDTGIRAMEKHSEPVEVKIAQGWLSVDTARGLGIKLEVPTPEMMLEILELVADMAQGVSDFNHVLKKLEATVKVVEKETALIRDDYNRKMMTVDQRQALWGASRFLSTTPRWLVSAPTKLANYKMVVARDLLQYVHKCSSFYKLPEPAVVVA